MFYRLVWQSLRESWKTALAAVAIGLFLMFSVELVTRWQLEVPPFRMHLPLSVLFLPAIFGALAFRADQRGRQYRFVAEHAGRPRMVWLARQIAWMLPIVACGIVVHVWLWLFAGAEFLESLRWLVWGNNVFQNGESNHWTLAVQTNVEHGLGLILSGTLVAWIAWLTAFAVGQFFSLALRSDVLAVMLSLAASVVILLLSYLVFAWRLTPWLFIAPVGISFLFATWLRVKDWLIDRRGVIRWAIAIAAIVVPIAVVLLWVPAIRVWQLRQPYPAENLPGDGSYVREFAEQVEKELALGRTVADGYDRLASQIADRPRAETAELDAEIIRLSRVECRLPWMLDNPTFLGRIYNVVDYSQLRAKVLRANDLDAALEMLMAARRIGTQIRRGNELNQRVTVASPSLVEWATASGQTPERVQRAVAELGRIDQRWPTPSDDVIAQYVRAREVIRGDNWTQSLAHLLNRFPGEARRAERALEILATVALDYTRGQEQILGSLDRRAETENGISPFHADLWRDQLEHAAYSSGMPYAVRTMAMTQDFGVDGSRQFEFPVRAKLLFATETSFLAASEFPVLAWLPDRFTGWINELAWRRAERVRLALIAYRLMNGRYPDSLQALATDYLTLGELRDPYGSGPFQYRLAGFSHWVVASRIQPTILAPPNTPLLWSRGSDEQPEQAEFAVERQNRGDPIRIIPDADLENTPAANRETVVLLQPNHWNADGIAWLRLPTEVPSERAQ